MRDEFDDFGKRFDKHFEKTSSRIERTAKYGMVLGLIGTVFSALFGLAIFGFIAWVVVKVMQANGVL